MKRTPLLILLIVPFALLLALAGREAPAARSLETVYQTTPERSKEETSVVRVAFTPDQVELVRGFGGWRELWDVDYEKGIFVVEATADEIAWLTDLGLQVSVDHALTTLYNTPNSPLRDQVSGIPGYPCYRTVEETYTSAANLTIDHPDLAQWVDVGDSWEKTQDVNAGYDMMVLVLTNQNIPGPKPKLFATFSIHAREYTPAELGTRFAEYLVNNYGSDADATWLLDHHEIHLMLLANPDGRKFAESGNLWRKNTNENYCSPTSSNRGADLNRNFEFAWGCCGGSSGSECGETYRGPSAASEPEVQAIQAYGSSIFPDVRPPDLGVGSPITTTGMYLDIHSYSELVLWPWGFTNAASGNGAEFTTLGRKLAYFNGYDPDQAIGLYPTDGTTDDFFYGELGVPSVAFELGTSFFQSCGYFESTILPDNLEALLYAAKSLRAPFMLPAGPDPTNLTLSNPVVPVGDPVTLTLTLDDTRYENQNGTEPSQNVIAGEYTIDTPFWITGTVPITYSLSAADGSFNNSIENAVAAIDTGSLSGGRHTVYVRGRDAGGNWGVTSAIFLDVIDPAVAPIIEGTVTDLSTGMPLPVDVTVGPVETAADPATGFYQAQVISGTYDISTSLPGFAPAHATVTASNFDTITQDLALAPFCSVLVENVEFDPGDWTAQTPWAITSAETHSPTHSWTDSPDGNYSDFEETSLTSPVVDLSAYTDVSLNFWQICDTESGYDYCLVEAHTSPSDPWVTLAQFDGPSNSWEEIELNANMLAGSATAQFRFRLTSDQSVTRDGWYVDDVVIRAAGASCVWERSYLPAILAP